MATKPKFTVIFYSRNTGRELALPSKKFANRSEAYDYADYVCSARPDTRMARIYEGRLDTGRYNTFYYGPTKYDLDHERSRYVKNVSKSGKHLFATRDPIPYWNVHGSQFEYRGRSTYGPLAPLNPTKKKKTAKKRK